MTSKRSFWVAFIPFLLSLIMILLILFLSKFLPPKLPLFYSLPWGERQLANHAQLLIIPAIIALVALCNLIISWQLHAQQILFKNILLVSSLLISLVLTITFLKLFLIFI